MNLCLIVDEIHASVPAYEISNLLSKLLTNSFSFMTYTNYEQFGYQTASKYIGVFERRLTCIVRILKTFYLNERNIFIHTRVIGRNRFLIVFEVNK